MKRILSWRKSNTSRKADSVPVAEVVKLVCGPKSAVPELKHMDAIIAATWSEDDTLWSMFVALSPYINGSNYVVWLLHSESMPQETEYMPDGATDNVLSQLSQLDALKLYNVYAGNEGPNAPDILRNYARYLDRRVRAYRDLKHDMIQIRSEKDPSVLSSAIEKREHSLKAVDMTKRLLRETKAVHEMIDALVECKIMGGTENLLGTRTLQMIVRDLVVLVQIGNEAMIALLERYFTMPRKDAAAVLQIYQNFCEQTEGVTDYLKDAKKMPALHTVRIPTFRHAPLSLAAQLEAWLNDPCFEQNRSEYQANIIAVQMNRIADTNPPPNGSANIPSVAKTEMGECEVKDEIVDHITEELRSDHEILPASGTRTDGVSTSTSQAIVPQRDQLSLHDRALRSLAQVLRTPEKIRSMRELKDERAQLVIDYLYSILVQPDPMPLTFKKHTVMALYKLSKSSQLYPRHYVLQDISLETVEDSEGFCDIHRGRYQRQDLCLKVVRVFRKKDTDAILKVFAKEAILWGQLIHPNILPFYGVCYLDETRKRICLASPWMENGNIVEHLDRNPSVPRVPLIYDIVNGLGYLHSENIIHGDLKGVNVLITDSGRACIADFGLSSIFSDKTIGHTISKTVPIGGSYRWSAPELLHDIASMPSHISDIWAFGCVCYQVLTRQVPFHELSSESQVIGKLVQGGLPSRPIGDNSVSEWDQITDEMWDLMTQCWDIDPELRPTCRQIIRNFRLEESADEREDETQERLVYDNTRFLDAMRERAGVLVDLAQIEQILKEL